MQTHTCAKGMEVPGNPSIAPLLKLCIFFIFVCILIYQLVKWWKRRGKCRNQKNVQVHCWFCQAETTVPVGNQNCFDCPECDQYNGFTEDGDYNKAIPAQYREELNHVYSRPTKPRPAPKPSLMCGVCQTNQQLKVQQLAAFVPSSQDKFDAEVEEYSHYLDEAYRLCPVCEDIVCNKLNEQDTEIKSKLMGFTLKQSIKSNMQDQTIISSHLQSQYWNKVAALRISSTLLAFLVLLAEITNLLDLTYGDKERGPDMDKESSSGTPVSSRVHGMSLLGLVSNVLSSLLAGKLRLRYVDGVSPLLWILHLQVHSHPLATIQSVIPQDSSLITTIINIVPSVLSAVLCVTCVKQTFGRREYAWTTKSFLKRRLDAAESSSAQIINPSTSNDATPPPSSSSTSSSSSSSRCDSEQFPDTTQLAGSEIRKRLLDQVDIDGLTLGPPGTMRQRSKDIWTAHTPPTSRPTTPMPDDRPSSPREFRPIISPATFNLSGMKRSPSQSSFTSSFSAALTSGQDHRVTSSKELFPDVGRRNSFQTYSDDSSHGSLPLGVTAKGPAVTDCNSPVQKNATPAWGISFLLPCLFGFSLGINAAAAVYFLYGR